MKQYFNDNDNLIDQPQLINFDKDNIKLSLKTNSGLFSKDHVDDNSYFLASNIPDGPYHNILDLGCGYGFIGLYLAKKFNTFITFIDITKRACEYTKINAQLNKLTNYEIINNDGLSNIETMFDLIVFNPPIHAGKEKMYQLIEEALAHLSKKGKLFLVIEKKHGAKSLAKDFNNLGYQVKNFLTKKQLTIYEISTRCEVD